MRPCWRCWRRYCELVLGAYNQARTRALGLSGRNRGQPAAAPGGARPAGLHPGRSGADRPAAAPGQRGRRPGSAHPSVGAVRSGSRPRPAPRRPRWSSPATTPLRWSGPSWWRCTARSPPRTSTPTIPPRPPPASRCSTTWRRPSTTFTWATTACWRSAGALRRRGGD